MQNFCAVMHSLQCNCEWIVSVNGLTTGEVSNVDNDS